MPGCFLTSACRAFCLCACFLGSSGGRIVTHAVLLGAMAQWPSPSTPFPPPFFLIHFDCVCNCEFGRASLVAEAVGDQLSTRLAVKHQRHVSVSTLFLLCSTTMEALDINASMETFLGQVGPMKSPGFKSYVLTMCKHTSARWAQRSHRAS